MILVYESHPCSSAAVAPVQYYQYLTMAAASSTSVTAVLAPVRADRALSQQQGILAVF